MGPCARYAQHRQPHLHHRHISPGRHPLRPGRGPDRHARGESLGAGLPYPIPPGGGRLVVPAKETTRLRDRYESYVGGETSGLTGDPGKGTEHGFRRLTIGRESVPFSSPKFVTSRLGSV